MKKINEGISGKTAAEIIYENDTAAVLKPWQAGEYSGLTSVMFNDKIFSLPDGVTTSEPPPNAPWVAGLTGTSPLEKVKQWVLGESYTITSYEEDSNGIYSAVIRFPDDVKGTISSVNYDPQGRYSSMLYTYGVGIFTVTLTITYLNNQIQTSLS